MLPFQGDSDTVRLLLRLMYADEDQAQRTILYESTLQLLFSALKAAHMYQMTGMFEMVQTFLCYAVYPAWSPGSHSERKPCVAGLLQLYGISCDLGCCELRQHILGVLHNSICGSRLLHALPPAVWASLTGSQVAEVFMAAELGRKDPAPVIVPKPGCCPCCNMLLEDPLE